MFHINYYDNYIASIKDDATFTPDEHDLGDIESKINELKDNIFKVEDVDITEDTPDVPGLDYSDHVTAKDFSNYMDMILTSLDGLWKEPEPETPSE